MSRIARQPVVIPAGVELELAPGKCSAKGQKGTGEVPLHASVSVTREGDELRVTQRERTRHAHAMAGTTRALLANLMVGVSQGFTRELEIHGVGYRAQARGRKLEMTLGFSHPVSYSVPEDMEIETPTQTEVVIRGSDRQRVGQVAAEIRRLRPPEPYGGKGVRYKDERILRKEVKKK